MAQIPDPVLLRKALNSWDPTQEILRSENLSPGVSKNCVYKLWLKSGQTLIAKISNFGNYQRFMEDHDLVQQWARLLKTSRFKNLLADPVGLENHVFSFEGVERWVVFYEEVHRGASLPRALTEAQIRSFAREIAALHRESLRIEKDLPAPSYSVRTDIIDLRDNLHTLDLTPNERAGLRNHCDRFLDALTTFSYETRARIPLLMDWNIGNFSITGTGESFSLESRWDYDWFRVEPRVFDFYFCSRVVSHVGDKTVFSYNATTFNEPRFGIFLRAYHEAFPLDPKEIDFLKEVYRFFILNYIFREGESFFTPEIYRHLRQEAFDIYLAQVDEIKPLVSLQEKGEEKT